MGEKGDKTLRLAATLTSIEQKKSAALLTWYSHCYSLIINVQREKRNRLFKYHYQQKKK